MKRRRHTPEQIVRKLREADRLLAEGADLPLVCRTLEVSVQTYQRWRPSASASISAPRAYWKIARVIERLEK
jgi:hypothetical protein